MFRLLNASLFVTLFAMTFPVSAFADQLKMFESQTALSETISDHMAKGEFSTLVDAVAPVNSMSTARIRILENAYSDNLPSPTKSVPLFERSGANTVAHRVEAWWDGEVYIYLGLLTHKREDGVAVLDFLLTSDVNSATRWYLTGTAK